MEKYTGHVLDKVNHKTDDENTFMVEAKDIDDAADKIAIAYIKKYKLTDYHEVDEAVIQIGQKRFEFSYYQPGWKKDIYPL